MATQAQELKCEIAIDAQRTGKMQLPVFDDLQKALTEFVNTTTWTTSNLPSAQQIDCSFFITVQEYNNNTFKANLQVQSSRPVFGSTMSTPVVNYKDEQFDFTYEVNEPLRYNPNVFESNLTATLSFYVYVILGMDADTFSLDGGEEYFAEAEQIAKTAAQSGEAGWGTAARKSSRYELSRQLNAVNYADFHQTLYLYHRKGLDVMHDAKKIKEGKNNIAEAIAELAKLQDNQFDNILIRSFLDAKAKEIRDVFTGGPDIDTKDLQQHLRKLSPSRESYWKNLP